MTVVAMLYNVNRDPAKSGPKSPLDFIPHAQFASMHDDEGVKRTPEELARDYQKLVATLAAKRK